MVCHQHCSLWRQVDHHEHYQLQARCATQNITTTVRVTRASYHAVTCMFIAAKVSIMKGISSDLQSINLAQQQLIADAAILQKDAKWAAAAVRAATAAVTPSAHLNTGWLPINTETIRSCFAPATSGSASNNLLLSALHRQWLLFAQKAKLRCFQLN